jgi:hypothetical protein
VLLQLDDRAGSHSEVRRRRASPRHGKRHSAALELAAAVRILGERRRVDVNDDLVALGTGAVAVGPCQCEIGHRDERFDVRGPCVFL